MKTETKTIALGKIAEAPWNTRSEISEASVRALAESIKADGLLQPLNVIKSDYQTDFATGAEFVCFDGCRRLNALRAIGAKDAPCRVWDITEDEAKVKTVTANIQREDDDPLLAAKVIGDLLAAGHNPEQIASKLGKSTPWVNRRRKLIALTEAAQKLVGMVTVDALERIASLPQKAQERVVDAAENRAKCCEGSMVTVADLRYDIERESRDLDNAVFDTENCVACEKRTGAQADLFGVADGKLGKCLDCKCFEKCVKAWTDAKIADVVPDGTEVVRIEYAWDCPSEATADKPSKKCPCAYVFVNHNGEVYVKFGPSKKQLDAEKKAHEDELAEKRKEKSAVRERESQIGDKFREFFGDEENRDAVVKAVKSCLAKPTKAQLAWIVDLVADNWGDIWDDEDFANVLRVFPFTLELCGISKDDAKWYIERNSSNNK